MKINAWRFLVSCNRKFDYRTVACPDFIYRQGASQLISTIRYRNLNEQGKLDLNCCEIDDNDFKLTLIYRRHKLTKEDLLPEINDTPTERGRPIILTEGIIIKEMRATEINNKKIIYSEEQFKEDHKKILEYYRKFWVNVNGYDLPYQTEEFELRQDKSSQKLMNIVLDPSSKKEDENNTLLTKKNNNEQLINRANFNPKNLNIKIRSFAFDTNRNYFAFVDENKSIGLYSYEYENVGSLNLDLRFTEIRYFDLQENLINVIGNLINNFNFSEPKKSSTSIAFSHNGEIIASAGNFKSKEELEVKLWKLKIKENEEIIARIEIKAKKDDCILIACSPNENIIAINNSNSINLYNNGEKTLLAGYGDSIKSIDISKTSSPLITMGDKGGNIKLWNLETKKLITSITPAHSSSINSVVFSPDGSIISSGSEDKNIKFWDSKTGNLIHSISTESAVNSVAFNAEGTLLVSGHDDYTIKLWDVKNKKLINTLCKHKAAVTSVGFICDSSILISVSKDLQAIVWSASN